MLLSPELTHGPQSSIVGRILASFYTKFCAIRLTGAINGIVTREDLFLDSSGYQCSPPSVQPLCAGSGSVTSPESSNLASSLGKSSSLAIAAPLVIGASSISSSWANTHADDSGQNSLSYHPPSPEMQNGKLVIKPLSSVHDC
ncbi:hypothetical protein SLA2020_050750 [Shorea laevis]